MKILTDCDVNRNIFSKFFNWNSPGGGKEIMKLAIPMTLTEASCTINTVVERLILSYYKPAGRDIGTDVAVVSVSWVTVSILIFLALGIVNYSTAFFAQYFGSGQNKKVGFLFWQTVYVSIIISGICAAFVPLMPFLFHALGKMSNDVKDPNFDLLIEAEIDYAQVLLEGSIVFLFYEIGSALCSGVEMTVPIVVVNISSLVVNGGLDFLFVLVFKLGYRGAAYATLAAKGFGTIMFVIILFLYKPQRVRRRFKLLAWDNIRPHPRQILKSFGAGLGVGVIRSLELIAWAFYIILLQAANMSAVLGAGYAMSVHEVAALFIYGITAAESVVAALYMGEENPRAAALSAVTSFKILSVYALIITLLYNLVPSYLLWPFAAEEGGLSDDPHSSFGEVSRAGVTVLHCFTAFLWGEMVQMCCENLLSSAGDTMFPAVTSLVGCVAGIVIPGVVFICAFKNRLTPLTITIMLAAYVWIAAVPLSISVLRGKWRSRRLISETDESSTSLTDFAEEDKPDDDEQLEAGEKEKIAVLLDDVEEGKGTRTGTGRGEKEEDEKEEEGKKKEKEADKEETEKEEEGVELEEAESEEEEGKSQAPLNLKPSPAFASAPARAPTPARKAHSFSTLPARARANTAGHTPPAQQAPALKRVQRAKSHSHIMTIRPHAVHAKVDALPQWYVRAASTAVMQTAVPSTIHPSALHTGSVSSGAIGLQLARNVLRHQVTPTLSAEQQRPLLVRAQYRRNRFKRVAKMVQASIRVRNSLGMKAKALGAAGKKAENENKKEKEKEKESEKKKIDTATAASTFSPSLNSAYAVYANDTAENTALLHEPLLGGSSSSFETDGDMDEHVDTKAEACVKTSDSSPYIGTIVGDVDSEGKEYGENVGGKNESEV